MLIGPGTTFALPPLVKRSSVPGNPQVLVMDEDENILAAFESFLKSEHCRVVPMSNMGEALRRIERGDIRLVIADFECQKQVELSFLTDLRLHHPDLPIIVITGSPGYSAELNQADYGADYRFAKPLDLDSLRSALRACLRLHEV